MFKTVSKELTSTMEELLPIITEIESLQGVDELKNLKDTIERAGVLVQECSEVGPWDLISKVQYTEKIEKINEKMFKFCQIQLQLLLLRNQLKSTGLLSDFIGCPRRDLKPTAIIKSRKFKFALLGLAALFFYINSRVVSSNLPCLDLPCWTFSPTSYINFITHVFSKIFVWLEVTAYFSINFIAYFLKMFLWLLVMACFCGLVSIFIVCVVFAILCISFSYHPM